jgi:apolipoprotein N-acyltransferase
MKNFLFKRNKFLFSLFLGVILSFTLPPYNLTFLGFLVFPLLLYLFFINQNQSRKLIFWIGFLFGYGYFLSNLYWIVYSLNFDENLTALKPLVLIFIPSLLAVFYGVASIFIKKLISKNFFFIIFFSVVISVFDFLRGVIFSGFPWNLFAYTWSWSLESLQILSFVGTYSLNLLTIFIFCLPYVVLHNFHYKKLFVVTASISISLLLNFFVGHALLNKNNLKKIPNFKVVLLQPDQSIKNLSIDNNEEKYVNNLIRASNPKAHEDKKTLFVWPEGVLFDLENSQKYKKIFNKEFSQDQQIIFGSTRYEGNKFFNSMVLLNNNAEIISNYDKIKLVPFGEFIPFHNFFEKIILKKITFGYGSFSKGSKRNPIVLNNSEVKFLPLICYEIIFSGLIDIEKKGYDFILNISEDGWFNKSIGTIQHFIHAKYRAIEEGKQVVRSTNQGITSSIKPNGKVDKRTNFNDQSAIVVDIYTKDKKTTFAKWGNKIFYLLIFFTCVFLFLFRKRNE